MSAEERKRDFQLRLKGPAVLAVACDCSACRLQQCNTPHNPSRLGGLSVPWPDWPSGPRKGSVVDV